MHRPPPAPLMPFLLAAVFLASPAAAGPVGDVFRLSGSGCRFPDAAYGARNGKYLVVWSDYASPPPTVRGRLVADDGTPAGEIVAISKGPFKSALYPAVAYNDADDEFLVTWDDEGRGDVIHGQRVRASDGALLGENVAVGTVPGGIRSAAAWSGASRCYLIAYYAGNPCDVHARRVSRTGALLGDPLNVSSDGVFSGYPAVAWGDAEDQFLVTWDHDDGNIHGRRVDAASGALRGDPIRVTSQGAQDRSCIAWDGGRKRWLVQYNYHSNKGYSYDQYGRFVNADGTLAGGPIPLAHTPGFEGDTLFGGDVAFAPLAGRFFSAFQVETGMGGQESDREGSPVGAQAVLGAGHYTSLNNAADVKRSRFLTVWEGLIGKTHVVHGRLYETAPEASLGPVSAFAAEPKDLRVHLTWTNPPDAGFRGTVIRFAGDAPPATPHAGTLLVDDRAPPGSARSFAHLQIPNDVQVHYSAWTYEAGGAYTRIPAQAAAAPRLHTGVLVVRPAAAIAVDASPSDWNLAELATPIPAGADGSGDVAVTGWDGGTLHLSGYDTDYSLPRTAADHSARVAARHDADYLYLWVRIEDNDPRFGRPAHQNWVNDCFEIDIDPARDGNGYPIAESTSDVQIVLDAGNRKNVYRCASAYRSRVLDGVTTAVARDAAGWQAEIRIAKAALDPALPGAGGGAIGLDFAFRDDDNDNDRAESTLYAWHDPERARDRPGRKPRRWGKASLLPLR